MSRSGKQNGALKQATRIELEVDWETPIGRIKGGFSQVGLSELHFTRRWEERPAVRGNQVREMKRSWNAMEGNVRRSTIEKDATATTQYLSEYFGGREPRGNGPRLDWSARTAFEQEVYRMARKIRYGKTKSYGELAAAVGRPRAARAIGGAMRRNPMVLLMPCHRVTGAGGELGGFLGGAGLKRYLLEHEQDINKSRTRNREN